MESAIFTDVQILDFTAAYDRLVIREGSWRRYERCYPALFQHYFRFWAKRTYPDVRTPIRQLEANAARLRQRLPVLAKKFGRLGLKLNDIEIVLFVGKDCTNGHAFLDSSNWVVWLPVETYPNDQLLDVFAAHEILHALHYCSSPEYYFKSTGEQRQLIRLLVTEGLATYLTMRVLGCSSETAHWGGYLSKRALRRWLRECSIRLNEMAEFAEEHLHSKSHADFFQANEPADIMRYRGGYFLGNVLIERVVQQRKLSPSALLRLSRPTLDSFVLQQLTSIGADRI